MSRIGKKSIEIPQKVEVSIDDNHVMLVRGPRGEMSRKMPQSIEFKVDADAGTVTLANRQHFADSAWLSARWELADDGVVVAAGEVELPTIAPGVSATASLRGWSEPGEWCQS